VLDGLPIFSKAMTREILANYLPPFRPTWDGSHLAGYWTRVRDQSAWFPWYRRERATISPREFATPEALHESFMDFCRSGDNYRRGYSAAFRYDVRRAARALRVPATFMARDDDMLYPHLDLLPKLRRGQTIERHGSARDPYLDAMAAAVRRHARPGRPPADPGLQPRRGRVTKSYVDLDHGQVVVRAVVDAKKGRPLLLLHDGRSSSAMLEPLLLEFGRSRRVYAIELPGNGDSDPLPGQPTIADYARAVGAAMARLRLSSVDVYGQASGGSVAIELAASEPRSVRRLVLHGVNLFPAAERRRLAANYTPPIEVQWHGGHLYATWLMLRDDQVFFPWFDRRRTARRLIDGSWDAETLHRRAVEVLKARRTYHLLTQAAFRYDVAGRLPKVRATTLVAAEKGHVLERFSPAAMALARNGRQVTLPGTTRGMVRVINAFLTT
jgi:pimeloyl-ACP methyl ester carboxylesterase